ncbi:MAG: hypothetical protein Q8J74_09570 [Candidatus Didemnitutus sp.]|nr:hypothetical protein [Candidatus Didemnitutus sp.]
MRNPDGEWQCGVGPEGVRPYWVRQGAILGGTVAVALLLAALGVWGTMRVVGFNVSPRQIMWPPAWSELDGVRARFFLEQARELLAEGKFREAANSLTVAYEMNPGDYEIALTLAEFYQVGRPAAVDPFFEHLMRNHPERRNETALVWFRSLLLRGRLDGVGLMAARQLAGGPENAAAWTHALLFAVRLTGETGVLKEIAGDEKIPARVRRVLELELRLRQANRADAPRLLQLEPIDADFPYARVHRIERLIEFGATNEALALLEQGRGMMAGRDVVRLALAAHAVGRNRLALLGEAEVLLARDKGTSASAVALLAQHLVVYPNEAILARCLAAVGELPADSPALRNEAVAAVYAAAVVGGKRAELPAIRRHYLVPAEASAIFTPEDVLARNDWATFSLLKVIRPMSADLNYAILERLFAEKPAAKK